MALTGSRSAQLALNLLPGPVRCGGGPLELGLVSVSKLQVRLVRLIRFTMLESLGVSVPYEDLRTTPRLT